MKETQKKVIEWANDRNIIQGGTIGGQLKKLAEEYGELVDAILKGDPNEINDAIGDMTVVLTIIAAMEYSLLSDCYECAYNEIKDRKGTMVNGVFVKEKGRI